MTSLKCVHLNSVTRLILITILVSIFSQSFDCKLTNSLAVETSKQGNFSQPIDNGTRPEINLNNTLGCTSGLCIYMTPAITNDKPSRNKDTKGPVVKRAVHPPDDERKGNSTIEPEISTTSKLRITTSKPIDKVLASTSSNQVRPSEAFHLRPKSRYEPGMDMRSYNDRRDTSSYGYHGPGKDSYGQPRVIGYPPNHPSYASKNRGIGRAKSSRHQKFLYALFAIILRML